MRWCHGSDKRIGHRTSLDLNTSTVGIDLARTRLHLKRIATDEDGHLIEEVGCIRCGYNLFGVYRDGVCPECGVPVGRSTLGDYLQFCDPAWVKQLARGANFMLGSVAVFYVATFAALWLFELVMIARGDSASRASTSVMVSSAIVVVAGAVLTLGIWFITSREPGRAKGGATARYLARGLILGAIACHVVLAVIAGMETALPIKAFQFIGMLLMLAGVLALLEYLRRLALRGPDVRLAMQTLILMIAFGLLSCFALMSLISSLPGQWLDAMGFLACGMIMLVVGLGIWAILVGLMYVKMFNTAAKTARRTWAREVGPSPAVDSVITDRPEDISPPLAELEGEHEGETERERTQNTE